jgi:hypothetical protein
MEELKPISLISVNKHDKKQEKSSTEIIKLKEYGALYHDRLQLLAINQCLKLHVDYVKNKSYEENYAQGELIDHRDKRIESCLDQVLELHSAFNKQYNEFLFNK